MNFKNTVSSVFCFRALPLLLFTACLYAMAAVRPASAGAPYEVAAYYWPNWHVDARNEQKMGKGWTEWDLLKAATPRFPGHQQPLVPLWGYEDEADPKAMAKKIDAAADNGLTAFIFDWYYYNNGIALERCLHEGFLKAPNRNRLKFAIMWANHDYVHLFPAKIGKEKELWNPGDVTLETFVKATDLMIKDYFSQPNYWKIDGMPYFSIYDLDTLMKGLGGEEKTNQALEDFRKRCKAAGFPGVHINVCTVGLKLKSVKKETISNISFFAKPAVIAKDAAELIAALRLNSVTSYTWMHHVRIPEFPGYPYEKWGDAAVSQWPDLQNRFGVPYHPNVSVGWDSSPRTDQTQEYKKADYPHTSVVTEATPALFKKHLEKAKAYLDTRPPGQRILTINSWNEWTEGSYIEPDTRTKMERLDALKSVFPPK